MSKKRRTLQRNHTTRSAPTKKGRETYPPRASAHIHPTTTSSHHLSIFRSLKNTLQRITISSGFGTTFLTLFCHLWSPSEGKSDNSANNASVQQRLVSFLFSFHFFFIFFARSFLVLSLLLFPFVGFSSVSEKFFFLFSLVTRSTRPLEAPEKKAWELFLLCVCFC